jgi:DNA-binding MarR family transcriptional regulator
LSEQEAGASPHDEPLDDAVYAQLLRFRRELRSFLRWSEQTARSNGLTPAVHQLLLAVRGSDRAGGATVGDVANALGIRHHSAVQLAYRAEELGLVTRSRGVADQREVRLALTGTGDAQLARLTRLHRPRILALTRLLAEVTGPDTGDVQAL